VKFSILKQADALDALEVRWTRLVERSPEASVFQTFAWQSIWWRVFGKGRDLRIILAEDGEELVGLLPVYVERTDLLPAVGLRKLRLIGYGGDTAPDDLGAITAGGDPKAVIESLVDGLLSLQGEWDIAELDDLHPDSALIKALGARLGGQVALEEGARISYVELPETWDGYLAKLSSNRRWKLRRGRKKLHEHKPYRFHLVRSADELERFYPELVRLHHDRWEHRSEDFGFSTDGYVGFHRDVMAAMLEADCLRLMLLIGEDETVMAANYCYRWRGGFYFFQGGFARDYERFRIGEVLMGHAIEQAIGEGMQVFDMLRGEHDYKKSLTDRIRTRTHLRIYQPTLRTLSYRTLRAGYRQVRRLYPGRDAGHDHGAGAERERAA
jgi:CelD/BcsL family acetyltransferase involved in cellulose biosynthesis